MLIAKHQGKTAAVHLIAADGTEPDGTEPDSTESDGTEPDDTNK